MSWLSLSVGSGLAAATNGLFAKLTTTDQTSKLSAAIARFLSLSPDSKPTDYAVRGTFFFLNLLFNAIMWGLFTAALARGPTATKVSIVNTSANFMTTAFLGWLVFAEALPPTWWAGASLLVVGNVLIGRRDELDGANDGRAYQTVPGSEEELRSSGGNSIVADSESDDEEREGRGGELADRGT